MFLSEKKRFFGLRPQNDSALQGASQGAGFRITEFIKRTCARHMSSWIQQNKLFHRFFIRPRQRMLQAAMNNHLTSCLRDP